jgi:hypothetical protein
MSPTISYHHVYDPSYAYDPSYTQLMSERDWNVAWSDIVTGGMTPLRAADKACEQREVTSTKFPIQQA